MSNSSNSSIRKSFVLITIDFLLNPALNAIIFSSLNLQSITPFSPIRPAKGGTAPGFTPKAVSSASSHILAFFPKTSTFRSLLQLILWLALQSNMYTCLSLLLLTSIVLDPHSKGVFRISADSLAVLADSCSNTSKWTYFWVRQSLMVWKTFSPADSSIVYYWCIVVGRGCYGSMIFLMGALEKYLITFRIFMKLWHECHQQIISKKGQQQGSALRTPLD